MEYLSEQQNLNSANAEKGPRLPPHSIESEQALLGALMQDNSIFENIEDMLFIDDFYRRDHHKVFQVIHGFHNQQYNFDSLTIFESFSPADRLLIPMEYLQHLVNNLPNLANVKSYANIIHQRALLRELITAAAYITNRAYEAVDQLDVSDVLDEAETLILSINERRQKKGSQAMHLADALEEVLETLEAQVNIYTSNTARKNVTGISTGFTDLDNCTTGLQRGDLVIVAARPSMGKTAFAVNMAENAAFNDGLPILIFSMEMGASQLAMRILSSQSEVQVHKIKIGDVASEDWAKLSYASAKMREASLYIDETAGLSANELRSRARRLSKRHGRLGMIVVDYLQLMSGNKKVTHENRATEISEISRALKSLAKEMDCPVVALSQLNRSVEQRPNKMPMLSDLRESGAIEQDADLILFIYRDEFYEPNTEKKGLADIKIGKQRNGAAGNAVTLAFQGHYSRFKSFADPNNKEGNPQFLD